MITQMSLAMGVQELSGINEILEATNITGLGLIRDATNPLARQVQKIANFMANIFQHSSQVESAKAAETSEQMETTQTDSVGNSSALYLVQSVPYRPRGMPFRLIMILQAMWTKAMTRLTTLEAKVSHMEGGIKPRIDTYFANQDRQVQGRLDAFESRIT